MNASKKDEVKTAIEIGNLAAQLRPIDQAYVLNTINTLLFSRQEDPTALNPTDDQRTA